jgi:hypothetical protein
MTCERCGFPYPDELVSPLLIGVHEGGAGLMVCGICALEVINTVHGKKRKRFPRSSSAAEDMRQRAIRWRKAHIN